MYAVVYAYLYICTYIHITSIYMHVFEITRNLPCCVCASYFCPQEGYPAICIAAEEGHVDAVNLLVQEGASPNSIANVRDAYFLISIMIHNLCIWLIMLDIASISRTHNYSMHHDHAFDVI